MAEDATMETCPSPEIGDSRKRPLDSDPENEQTKRSHFSSGKLTKIQSKSKSKFQIKFKFKSKSISKSKPNSFRQQKEEIEIYISNRSCISPLSCSLSLNFNFNLDLNLSFNINLKLLNSTLCLYLSLVRYLSIYLSTAFFYLRSV
ncbi:GD15148 [Drosophila simulans]|uniref:GD15148 n=1 Tax=Drosophila simulans TaxID=7240 RepID=B4NT95_DROSI|nr:GD15148 [Drosophila simulans]